MKFWATMFLFTLLIPLTMIIYGAIYLKRAPKKINMVHGYRTALSMKNEETWKFAQHHFGKIWLTWGTAMLIITIPVNLMCKDYGKNVIGLVGLALTSVQIIVLMASNIPTSRALKKKFG